MTLSAQCNVGSSDVQDERSDPHAQWLSDPKSWGHCGHTWGGLNQTFSTFFKKSIIIKVNTELFHICSILGNTNSSEKSHETARMSFPIPATTQGFRMRTLAAQELSLAAIDSALC